MKSLRRRQLSPDSGISSKRSRSDFDSFKDEEEGDIGIIEKVTLKNFMCHSNLEFTFGPHVNFIIGRNGSGKSAVLNGIILALGSRSQVTGRNPNIKGFIQNGKSAADISVTLRNTGQEAYKPNNYGPRITVERKITSDGVSSYRLKGDGGKLVSSKKEELHNMLEALNIQVENPVSILTQDASRCFLDSKDPKRKYDLFFKATQLERLRAQYADAEQTRNDAEDMLRQKNETLPEAKKEVDKWALKLKDIDMRQKQKEEIKQLENTCAWAIVKEKEMERDKRYALLETAKAAVNKTDNKSKVCEERLQKFVTECDKMLEQRIVQDKAVCTLKDKTDQLSGNIYRCKREAREFKQKKSVLELEIKSIEEEIRNLKQSIEELTRKSQLDFDKEEQIRNQKRQELEAKKSMAERTISGINENILLCKRRIEDKDQQIQSIVAEINNLQYMLTAKSNEISTMERGRSSQENLYGQYIPELLSKIDAAYNRRVFKYKPVGPIGLMLTIKDRKWTFAVETCLSKSLLQSFCCDNKNDANKLRSIMDVVCRDRRPTIITSQFLNSVHDIRLHKVQCTQYPTVFDLVSCDNPVVLNCLIDQRSIENILLVEDSSIASSLMIERAPRNCHYTYTLKGDQIFPSPSYRYYSCKVKPSNFSLLRAYTEDDIQTLRAEMKAVSTKLEVKKNIELPACENEKETEKKREGTLLERLSSFKKTVIGINHSIYDLNVDKGSADLSAQQEDVKSREKAKVKIENEALVYVEEIREKEEERAKYEAEYNTWIEQLTEQQQDLDKLLGNLMTVENNKVLFQAKVQCFQEELKKEKLRVIEVEKMHKAAVTEAQARLSEAEQVCPRIETDAKSADIEEKITQMKITVTEQETILSKEDIQASYIEKKKKYISNYNEIKRLTSLIETLKIRINVRLQKFQKIRREITLRVQYYFLMNMNARNFTGMLNFNHEDLTLEITANPIKGTSTLYRTQGLSGGERSYVTVSLLLALWESSEIPFHILDEYDVFMDSTNKNTSMKVIMAKAEQQQKNQFIFLSPLDLPSTINSSVQIHRMPDPERTGRKRRKANDSDDK